MGLVQLITDYSAYNETANRRIVEWLRRYPETELYRETPSSFPTLDATVQHLLRAQQFWLRFISGAGLEGFRWAREDGQAAQALQALLDNSAAMRQVFSAYTEDELEEVLVLDTPWSKNSRPRHAYILHVLNHSTYHRGQLVTMGRSLGLSEGIPNTDFNGM